MSRSTKINVFNNCKVLIVVELFNSSRGDTLTSIGSICFLVVHDEWLLTIKTKLDILIVVVNLSRSNEGCVEVRLTILDNHVIHITSKLVSTVKVSTDVDSSVTVIVGVSIVTTNLCAIDIELQDARSPYKCNVMPVVGKNCATSQQLRCAIVDSDCTASIKSDSKTRRGRQTTEVKQMLSCAQVICTKPTLDGKVCSVAEGEVVTISGNQISIGGESDRLTTTQSEILVDDTLRDIVLVSKRRVSEILTNLECANNLICKDPLQTSVRSDCLKRCTASNTSDVIVDSKQTTHAIVICDLRSTDIFTSNEGAVSDACESVNVIEVLCCNRSRRDVYKCSDICLDISTILDRLISA